MNKRRLSAVCYWAVLGFFPPLCPAVIIHPWTHLVCQVVTFSPLNAAKKLLKILFIYFIIEYKTILEIFSKDYMKSTTRHTVKGGLYF